MVYTWERFQVFEKEPQLDYNEPLESDEDLQNYFVELNNYELKKEIFNLKDSEEGLKSLFGRKFLILGDYKVGKSS
ncbi:MAG: hypothetical protein ACTSWN_13405, partial [Promethearchaeota archaeon]